MDGYSTDSMQLPPENLYIYHWRPLLSPIPESGVYSPSGLSFLRAFPPSKLPLVEEIKEAILHSLSTTDRNGDGAIDVGDMIHLVNEVP